MPARGAQPAAWQRKVTKLVVLAALAGGVLRALFGRSAALVRR